MNENECANCEDIFPEDQGEWVTTQRASLYEPADGVFLCNACFEEEVARSEP